VVSQLKDLGLKKFHVTPHFITQKLRGSSYYLIDALLKSE